MPAWHSFSPWPVYSIRCRAGFRGKSAGQRPCTETDYNKKMSACGSCLDTDSRIGGMNAEEESPSAEIKRFGLGTCSPLPHEICYGRSTNGLNLNRRFPAASDRESSTVRVFNLIWIFARLPRRKRRGMRSLLRFKSTTGKNVNIECINNMLCYFSPILTGQC
jgi:hypothetical protein